MKNPPILIAVLGFFAALAGFGNLFFGLRVLGFDWFGVLGDIPAFDGVGLWGWLAVVTGLIWILVALGLWGLQPWARVFALIVTGFALFEAVLAFFQLPGTGVGFAMAIMPGLLFWYLNTREVKAAFGVGEPMAAAVAAAPVAAAAAPAPMAAPAPAPVAAAVVVAPAAAVVAQPAAEESVEAPVAAAAPMAAAPMAAASDEPAPAVDRMPIEDVEGIGPASGERLAAAGIKTTDDLLAAGARPYDRERIAEATGISSERIREWVDKIDLMRVPGVGPQYSDLLVAAGVGSPAELARRNAANLEVTFQEVVAARPGIVRRVPGEAEIADWIEAAGTLEQVVEH